MLKLPQVTLVCIDCVNHRSALNAMLKSMESIQFADALFISNLAPERTEQGITLHTIPKLESKEAYSFFVLNNLNDYIETPFCLVVQYDGYVINPHLWTDDFLNYDYIGAPWWYDHLNVGNGGFSLRSKILLAACQLENFERFHPEDDVICRGERPYLEKKYNVKFAPEILAERFSFEPNGLHPEFKNLNFGFHGVPNLILCT